ncbi:MAG TPA: hypothetical protein ENI85_01965 [Deltaproteobacteria bacterium]|nr:hypothetical protein [Deltaproteobacteria bacterium]
MSPSKRSQAGVSRTTPGPTAESAGFAQLVREFLQAQSELGQVLAGHEEDEIPFPAIRALVGDDDRAVLYRLKEKSHALFRSRGLATRAFRREALFDLAVGSLFHESMKLRETLYQRQVYAPRIEQLREAADEELDDALFVEFDRILGKSVSRLGEVVSEVRTLLIQTRDQARRLLVERAGDRFVTRCLLSRRRQVDRVFPEGFAGLLETMHGSTATGLIAGARALLESAYFVDAAQTLREARADPEAPTEEVEQLGLYAEGMQAFLDGRYGDSISTLSAWADLGAPGDEPDFARFAAAALGRLKRLVEEDADGAAIVEDARRLQARLEEAASV